MRKFIWIPVLIIIAFIIGRLFYYGVSSYTAPALPVLPQADLTVAARSPRRSSAEIFESVSTGSGIYLFSGNGGMKKMAGLAVNVDHIATIREARKSSYPDPVAAALIAETAGADGIVVHLREDRRHIQDRDVRNLRNVVQTKLILEMAATAEMVGIALDIQPDIVTLVPESREELTTEGGLDLMVHKSNIAETVDTLQNSGIPVSLFVDPDPEQIKLAHRINASMIEIHTGAFCDAATPAKKDAAFDKIVDAVYGYDDALYGREELPGRPQTIRAAS